jgi:shikimate kinase
MAALEAKRRNIFLVGPMGSGKSTIGRLLAKYRKLALYDSDREIEQRTGVGIPMIFEYEGEAGFRRREAEVIADLTRLRDIVLATGGGSVLLAENRAALAQNGFVIYLRCPLERQLERTHKDTHRPLLRTDNPRARLQELLATREPLYREVADLTVDTGRYSSRQAAREILHAFNHATGTAPADEHPAR